MHTDEPPPNPASLADGEARERRLRRLLFAESGLLVLALAGVGTLAVLWRDAVAESRRLEEQRSAAEIALVEAERQRAIAELAEARSLAQAEAQLARAEAEAERSRSNLAVAEYARAVQLAQANLQSDTTRRAVELLEGIRAEPRGWEWLFMAPRPTLAPPPRAKE